VGKNHLCNTPVYLILKTNRAPLLDTSHGWMNWKVSQIWIGVQSRLMVPHGAVLQIPLKRSIFCRNPGV
jgi:hypothetical protein